MGRPGNHVSGIRKPGGHVRIAKTAWDSGCRTSLCKQAADDGCCPSPNDSDFMTKGPNSCAPVLGGDPRVLETVQKGEAVPPQFSGTTKAEPPPASQTGSGAGPLVVPAVGKVVVCVTSGSGEPTRRQSMGSTPSTGLSVGAEEELRRQSIRSNPSTGRGSSGGGEEVKDSVDEEEEGSAFDWEPPASGKLEIAAQARGVASSPSPMPLASQGHFVSQAAPFRRNGPTPWLGALAAPLVARDSGRSNLSGAGSSPSSVVQAVPLRPIVDAALWPKAQEEVAEGGGRAASSKKREADIAPNAVEVAAAEGAVAASARAAATSPEELTCSQKHEGTSSVDSTTFANETDILSTNFRSESPRDGDDYNSSSDTHSCCNDSMASEVGKVDDLDFMLERPFLGLETILEEEEARVEAQNHNSRLSFTVGSRRSSAHERGPLGLLPEARGPLKMPEPLSVEMMPPALVNSGDCRPVSVEFRPLSVGAVGALT